MATVSLESLGALDYPKTLIDPGDEENHHGDPSRESSRKSSTSASASFGTVKATTSGELVPVTEVSLAHNDSIFFEHHIFLWKDPSVTITAKAMKGVGKRILAGLPVYVTEAHGPEGLLSQGIHQAKCSFSI